MSPTELERQDRLLRKVIFSHGQHRPPSTWLPEDVIQEDSARLAEAASRITAATPLVADVLGLAGTPIWVYSGHEHPEAGTDRPIFENDVVRFLASLLSREHLVVSSAKPPHGATALIIGSVWAAGRLLADLQGYDHGNPLHPIIGRPATGEPMLIAYAPFAADAKRALSYLNGWQHPIDEFDWGVTAQDYRTGEREILSRSEVYGSHDAPTSQDVGFMKSGMLLITCIRQRRYGNARLIVIAGTHPGETAAALDLFSAEALLTELKERTAGRSFQAAIAITKIVPNHRRRMMEVPRDALAIRDVLLISPDSTDPAALNRLRDGRLPGDVHRYTTQNLYFRLLFTRRPDTTVTRALAQQAVLPS